MKLFKNIKFRSPVTLKQSDIDQNVDDSALMEMLLRDIIAGQMVGINDNSYVSLEHAYKANPDVYAIINKIMNDAAVIPWKLSKVDENGDKEEIKDHKIIEVWHSPNPQMGGVELRKALFGFHQTTGDMFLNGVGPRAGSNKGQFLELYPMPSQYVDIITGGWREPVRGYTLRWRRKAIEIPAKEVLHMRMFNPEYINGEFLRGLSPVTAATLGINSSSFGQMAKASLYLNGGIKGFVSRGDGEREFAFSDEQQKRIAENLRKNYGGIKNLGKLYVTNAPAKWNEIGLSVVDMAIIEALEADRRTLCNIWGVPCTLMNDTNASTESNRKEDEKSYYVHKIKPLVDELKDEINKWWIPVFSEKEKLVFEPDYSGIEPLQKDRAKTAEILSKMKGVLTKNEIREELGYGKIDDPRFDEVWIGFGEMPLSEFSMQPESEEELQKFLKQEGIKMYN